MGIESCLILFNKADYPINAMRLTELFPEQNNNWLWFRIDDFYAIKWIMQLSGMQLTGFNGRLLCLFEL